MKLFTDALRPRKYGRMLHVKKVHFFFLKVVTVEHILSRADQSSVGWLYPCVVVIVLG